MPRFVAANEFLLFCLLLLDLQFHMEAVWGYIGQSLLCKEYSNTDYPIKGKWKIHARERVLAQTLQNTSLGTESKIETMLPSSISSMQYTNHQRKRKTL